MQYPLLPDGRTIPFVRLLIALITGILLQWNMEIALPILFLFTTILVIALLLFPALSQIVQFRLHWVRGCFILLLFISIGAIVTYTKDVAHHTHWIGKMYQPSAKILATIEEPPVEKENSYKALASIHGIYINNRWESSEGNVLLYFKKENAQSLLKYGDQIVLHTTLQPIANSGNPGAFNYKRYCAYQAIYFQAFLSAKDYFILPGTNAKWLNNFLFGIRAKVIETMQQFIPGKTEQGVAEALLIGFRDNLDKSLVQSYSNTGVVHIIAISGLHLGLIYGLLVWLIIPLKNKRWYQLIKPLIILSVLWIFTLAAGAAPSILRSAVMFTFIVLGESIGRKTNIYNTLAASAFCLLIFNPFFLWDVGFQLSYAAVLSIVVFMKPVYNWFYFPNKILNGVWKLSSVTISAQILTLPLILYYFHQFPNIFLVSNFVAVPLSSLIIYSELLLLLVTKCGWLAAWVGKLTGLCVWMMDRFIQQMDALPFAVSDGIKLTVVQALLLYFVIIGAVIWLQQKSTKALIASLIALFIFFFTQSLDILQHRQQQKLIVYNISQHSAIDIAEGNEANFIGDTEVLDNNFLRNFHLKPARVQYLIKLGEKSITTKAQNYFIQSNHTKIFFVNKALNELESKNQIIVDIIIISKNPPVYISRLQKSFHFKQLVFDSSNPLWKIEQWKKDCDSLHLRFHSVPEQGAFVMDL